MRTKGAYLLYLNVRQPLTLNVGMLGLSRFPAGRYVYVGSASRGIEQRIERHRRLAEQKSGKKHWHIDALLTHPKVRFVGYQKLEGRAECVVSKAVASTEGVTAPVLNFGSTDCMAGCSTHLYRIHGKMALQSLPKQNFSIKASTDGTGDAVSKLTNSGPAGRSAGVSPAFAAGTAALPAAPGAKQSFETASGEPFRKSRITIRQEN
jgi:Uri superfamily endonuclease